MILLSSTAASKNSACIMQGKGVLDQWASGSVFAEVSYTKNLQQRRRA
jgi:hypothetical protein